MRPSRFDYIMLLLLLILMTVMAISSCTTTRHTVPTYDDLAGCPMAYGVNAVVSNYKDPFEPVMGSEIDLSGLPACDHFYVHQATPGRDTVYLIPSTIKYNDRLFRPQTTVTVTTRPCICIYCHHLNNCFKP